MNWLDRIREFDAQLEIEYRERTKNEKGLSKSDFWFLIGLGTVIVSTIFFVLADFNWLGIIIIPIYLAIMLLLFRKSLFIENKRKI